MNAAVGLTAGLGLGGDRCIRVIPRQSVEKARHFRLFMIPFTVNELHINGLINDIIDKISFKKSFT